MNAVHKTHQTDFDLSAKIAENSPKNKLKKRPLLQIKREDFNEDPLIKDVKQTYGERFRKMKQ